MPTFLDVSSSVAATAMKCQPVFAPDPWCHGFACSRLMSLAQGSIFFGGFGCRCSSGSHRGASSSSGAGPQLSPTLRNIYVHNCSGMTKVGGRNQKELARMLWKEQIDER